MRGSTKREGRAGSSSVCAGHYHRLREAIDFRLALHVCVTWRGPLAQVKRGDDEPSWLSSPVSGFHLWLRPESCFWLPSPFAKLRGALFLMIAVTNNEATWLTPGVRRDEQGQHQVLDLPLDYRLAQPHLQPRPRRPRSLREHVSGGAVPSRRKLLDLGRSVKGRGRRKGEEEAKRRGEEEDGFCGIVAADRYRDVNRHVCLLCCFHLPALRAQGDIL